MEETETTDKLDLLIVDDQQIIVDGLAMILGGAPQFGNIIACTAISELMNAIEKHRPDVILMDFNMPEIDGIQCIEKILERFPEQKILMLTGYDDTELIREALKIGALGYVLKNVSKEELIIAIETVNDRRRYLDQQVQNRVVEAFILNEDTNATGQVSKNDSVKLSSREIEVLKLIAEGKSSSKIAEQLFISMNTVDTHRKNMMAKCGVNKVTELITFATKNNLI
ncbi:response regulator [Sphingobacterium chuzhouense]|uniref:Response regulator transcription factor n=1 Tax=Sphingobacterium chuzhouense TaxID=1742264 RepID=A0ABR7XPD1_9SPHI|nr:response regulator transcription factor [Sphingobacterium chuzhouense]MBD1421032.1 response regulator transcription factor [Sphingobacterium chuzhouense]